MPKNALNRKNIKIDQEDPVHEQKKIIRLRQYVHRLYFQEGYSKNRIVREVGVSKHFVIRWTQSEDQDLTRDNRGWPKGKRRKWDKETIKRIKTLHQELENDPKAFFSGASAIAHLWRKRYKDPPPPLRTIGQIKKDLHLTSSRKKGSSKGAAKYFHYPERTIYGGYLGGRVMEADFIERRYLKGNGQPLHFVGFSAKQTPKIRFYKRIQSLTSKEFINACEDFFGHFDVPDVLKLDNAAAFIGSMSGKRTISKTIRYLLSREIIPVFSVPRRPFTQASIEGNNSVFSRFFWNRRIFKDINDIDRQLEWFNQSSMDYTGYVKPPQKKKKRTFIPKIYFIRQVHEMQNNPDKGYISVVNENIELPPEWINYFVLAEWDLQQEQLTVYFEEENQLVKILGLNFPMNKNSLKFF